jgi:outer membrane protein assembly factor BamB
MLRRARRGHLLVVTFVGIACVLAAAAASSTSFDWPAYLFGSTHSSANLAAGAITPQNATSLVRAWNWIPDPPTMVGQPGPNLEASPTVYQGRIYIGAATGVFYALDEQTGTVIWKHFLGFVPKKTLGARGFTSTATVAPDPVSGDPTVYVYSADGNLYALDANDGTIVWQSVVATPSSTKSDYYAWSSPAVVGGRIYVGISSQGDHPLVRGGAVAFDQATGARVATYYTVPAGFKGGSVWSSPGSDGQSVWLTTGNPAAGTPDEPGDSNSVVRLDAATFTRQEAWTVPQNELIPDSDFGGSPTLFTATVNGNPTPLVGACNKNGIYYALRQTNLAAGPVWQLQEGAPDNIGPGLCLPAAIWDGSRLFLAGNGTTINGTSYEGSVRELDPATGAPIWETGLPGSILGTPSLNGAGVIAAAAFDTSGGKNAAWLIDAATGAILKQVTTKNSVEFAQPVFADNYLLLATSNHGLFAYRPGPSPRVPTPLGAAGSPPSAAPAACGTSWTIAKSADQGTLDGLFGVAPVSSTDAWAVGDRFSSSSGKYRTLTERWNGTTWKVVTSPNTPSSTGSNNFLNDVAAVSSTDVWAVGSYINATQSSRTLIEHWDGTSWQIVTSPSVGTDSYLEAAAAKAANDVWAVGYSYSGGVAQSLIEHWNGTSWQVASSPNPGSRANVLSDVAVSPTGDVWAVGYQATAAQTKTLVERFNGTSWNAQVSPGTSTSFLEGVSVAPNGNVWAVGYQESGGVDTTLTLHRDATTWSLVPSANPSASLNVLLGASAAADTDVWAVGYAHQGGADQTLSEHWDGTGWSVAPSPNAGGVADYLAAVALDPAGRYWSPGYTATATSGARTLIEQLCP